MNPTLRSALNAALFCGTTLTLITGCSKKADNSLNFTNAINTYYAAHPACLWSESKKFPVQEETSDTTKTSRYDALVDQGLLVRTTAEKKKMIIATKQVNNYDISDSGRAAWMADPQQPGFGNFCYGHRKVTAIDSSTPTTDAVGATTNINYHYTLTDPPAWASAPETQTAYPQIRADLAGPKSGAATLTNTNSGWTVSRVASLGTATSSSNPDGSIVQ
jgi:hypothetical protein